MRWLRNYIGWVLLLFIGCAVGFAVGYLLSRFS
jgi:hypothetical protein